MAKLAKQTTNATTPTAMSRNPGVFAVFLYAIPRGVNRWAVALVYLTDVLFTRMLVSMGLSSQSDAEFSTSAGIPLPKTG